MGRVRRASALLSGYLQSISDLSAPQLGALVVREAVARAGIDPALVDECIMGNVIQAGNGQNPARQAALNGGLGDSRNSPCVPGP